MTGKTNSANKKIELEEVIVNPGASDVIKTADDGKGFSKVTVSGDADLIAANIREGIDIFGILGTLKEGKSGIDFGEVTLASYASAITVSHDLGATPSFVALVPVFYEDGGNTPDISPSYYWGVVASGSWTMKWSGTYGTNNLSFKLAKGVAKNANTITFSDDIRWAQGAYKWFAIV